MQKGNQTLNFKKLITEYKQENFKKLPLMHHEFLYACLYPTLENCVITLEKNFYPLESDLFNLVKDGSSYYQKLIHHMKGLNDREKIQKLAELAGIDHKQLTIVTEEDPQQKHEEEKSKIISEVDNLGDSLDYPSLHFEKRSSSRRRESITKKEEKQIYQKDERGSIKETIKRLNSMRKNQSRRHSVFGKDLKKEEVDTQEFIFKEPITFKEEKYEQSNKIQYAISIWKIPYGQQPYLLSQYQFTQSPRPQKFFISHDSKNIFLFLINEDQMDNQIESVKVLTIDNLQVLKDINNLRELKITEVVDANLIWDSNYLYIQTPNDIYLINIKTGSLTYSTQTFLETEDKATQVECSMFKETERGVMYCIIWTLKISSQSPSKQLNSEHYYLYKIGVKKGNTNVFDSKNKLATISKSNLDYIGDIQCDKYLSCIYFPSQANFYVYNVHSQSLKTIRNVLVSNIQKNSYLYENPQIVYIDENNDHYITSIQNTFQRTSIQKLFDLDDFKLGDLSNIYFSDYFNQLIIGKKNVSKGESKIQVKFSNIKKGESEGSQKIEVPENECIEFIQETSEYLCVYPQIFYCKGNKELFIQSVHFPTKILKLQLEDTFICFIEMNSRTKLKPHYMAKDDEDLTFSHSESIAFLTTNDNQLFLNILEYQVYEKQGCMIKALFTKVRHKESKDTDYILIRQYHQIITIKSFFTVLSLSVERSNSQINNQQQNLDFLKFPIITLQSKSQQHQDVFFFVTKDGYSCKIENINYENREFQNPVQTVLELKTSDIFIFTYHEGYFYIMDDTMTLKQYYYDRKNEKLKSLKIFEFSQDYKEQLGLQSDYDDIQVTSKGVYRGLMFYPYFDSACFNKDFSILKTDPIFNINQQDLFAGPKKLNHTKNVFFVTRGDTNILNNETTSVKQDHLMTDGSGKMSQADQVETEQIIFSEESLKHNIPFESRPKYRQKSRDEILRHDSEVLQRQQNGLQSGLIQRSLSLKDISLKIEGYQLKEKSESMLSLNEINLFANSKRQYSPASYRNYHNRMVKTKGQSGKNIATSNLSSKPKNTGGSKSLKHESVFAWIVPFLDSNVIFLTHNTKEFNNKRQNVTFSSFINNDDEVICQINSNFYIFNKNGSLLYQLDIYINGEKNNKYIQEQNLKIENISPNFKYFMFYNDDKFQFEIFEITREKNLQNSVNSFLKKTLQNKFSTFCDSSKMLERSKQQVSQSNRYNLKYIKRVKQQAKKINEDDYFNQRLISNDCQVFQLVQAQGVNQLSLTMRQTKDLGNINFKIFDDEKLDLDESNQEMIQEKKLFKFYIDETEHPEVIYRFNLIKQHLQSQNEINDEVCTFGYQMIGDFLFIKRKQKIEFLKILETENQTNNKIFKLKNNEKAKFIKLIFDKNTEINRIVETQDPNLIQIISSCQRYIYVITWNIQTNMEHQMTEIPKTIDYNPGHLLCRGINENMNYLMINNNFYDLKFTAPFKFFKGSQIAGFKHCMNMNERKLSKFNKRYLDQNENNKIFMTYSFLDLCYLKGLQSINQDQYESSHLLIQHMHIRVKGMTVFSTFVLNFQLLKLISDEIVKQDEQDHINNNEQQINSHKTLFLNILYPNYYNKNAFDLAMQKKSPKSIEIILDNFSHLEIFTISKHILHHFKELLQMEIVSFQNYLDTCLFQQTRIKEIKNLKWNNKSDQLHIDYHTSYLGDIFYDLIIQDQSKVKWFFNNEEALFNQETKHTLMNEEDEVDRLNQIENFNEEHSAKTLEATMHSTQEYNVSDLKRIETQVVEFDWIFKGKESQNFLKYLATTKNDSIFTVHTIKIIIDFLWDRFFFHIMNKIFIPFMVRFVLFFIQATFIYEKRITLYEAKHGLSDKVMYDEYEFKKWSIIDDVFIAVLLPLSLYFFFIELRQFLADKKGYFKSFWNWFDMTQILVNISYLLLDLNNVDPRSIRILSSFAMLLMWLKLLYFLRLFAPTAALIRMIMEIFNDIGVFLIVYCIGIIGFANSLLILSYNLDSDNFESLYEGNLLLSIIYSYRQGLGDFDSSHYRDSNDYLLWYFLFLLHTFFIQIVLLNLLIAIMADTFDKVTEKKEESKLREICEMMYDFEYVLNREREFKHSKYIVVLKVEKAQTNINLDWEGKLTTLKNHFSTIVSDSKRDTKSMIENLKEEVIGNCKSMEQKILEVQHLGLKQSAQMNHLMQRFEKIEQYIMRKEYKDQQLRFEQNLSSELVEPLQK